MANNELKTIITQADSALALVTYAEALGKSLKSAGLNTSQIRALFGEVRQIQAQWGMDDAEQQQLARRRLVLLKPKMAYRARRASGRAVQQLVDELQPALDFVVQERDIAKQSQNFQRFVEFFEAILAYHKAAGGN